MNYRKQLIGSASLGFIALGMAFAADDAAASVVDDSVGEFSLADLADLDVSDFEEVRFENTPAGIYLFEVTEASLGEKQNKDDEKRFIATVVCKIVEVISLLKAGVDKESLVGKTITHTMYINPADSQDDIKKAIGRIRAFVSDVGMESAGTLGNIVENLVGHRFTSKVVEQKDKQDPSTVYSKLRVEPKKKTK